VGRYSHAGNKKFPGWEQIIPTLGTKYSQAGNKLFPRWEFFWGHEMFLRRGIILITEWHHSRKAKAYVHIAQSQAHGNNIKTISISFACGAT
jgi:hypothetical protein